MLGGLHAANLSRGPLTDIGLQAPGHASTAVSVAPQPAPAAREDTGRGARTLHSELMMLELPQ